MVPSAAAGAPRSLQDSVGKKWRAPIRTLDSMWDVALHAFKLAAENERKKTR